MLTCTGRAGIYGQDLVMQMDNTEATSGAEETEEQLGGIAKRKKKTTANTREYHHVIDRARWLMSTWFCSRRPDDPTPLQKAPKCFLSDISAMHSFWPWGCSYELICLSLASNKMTLGAISGDRANLNFLKACHKSHVIRILCFQINLKKIEKKHLPGKFSSIQIYPKNFEFRGQDNTIILEF